MNEWNGKKAFETRLIHSPGAVRVVSSNTLFE